MQHHRLRMHGEHFYLRYDEEELRSSDLHWSHYNPLMRSALIHMHSMFAWQHGPEQSLRYGQCLLRPHRLPMHVTVFEMQSTVKRLHVTESRCRLVSTRDSGVCQRISRRGRLFAQCQPGAVTRDGVEDAARLPPALSVKEIRLARRAMLAPALEPNRKV